MGRHIWLDMEGSGNLRIQVHYERFALQEVINLAMPGVFMSSVVKCLFTYLYEIGEHATPSPAGISKHLPGIQVGLGATGHDEPVEDGPAAHDMSDGILPCVIIQELLGSGGYIPGIG